MIANTARVPFHRGPREACSKAGEPPTLNPDPQLCCELSQHSPPNPKPSNKPACSEFIYVKTKQPTSAGSARGCCRLLTPGRPRSRLQKVSLTAFAFTEFLTRSRAPTFQHSFSSEGKVQLSLETAVQFGALRKVWGLVVVWFLKV